MKVLGRKLMTSDPYWNTDQGDFEYSEAKDVKSPPARNLQVILIGPERQ